MFEILIGFLMSVHYKPSILGTPFVETAGKNNMGVSQNGGILKWMIYNGKSY